MKKGYQSFACLIFMLLNLGLFGQKFECKQPVYAGEHCSSVSVDSEGSYYFTGDVCTEAGQQMYFNDTPIPYYPNDFLYSYIVKTDDMLNPNWVVVAQAGGYVGVSRLKVDHEDNLIFSCSFAGSIRIGSNYISASQQEYSSLVAKIDQDGKLIWGVTMKSDRYYIRILDFVIDEKNNIAAAITFFDNITITSNDSTLAFTNDDAYGGLIARISKNGDLKNARSISCSNSFKLKGIACGDDQNITATGWWSGTADFMGEQLVSNYSDIFIINCDSLLNKRWIRQIGSETNSSVLEFGSGVEIDNNNDILISGTVLGSADFGGEIVDATVKNIFLAKYTQDGDMRWVRQAGGPNGLASYCENGYDLYVDKDDFVYLMGDFGPSAEFEGQTIEAYDDPENSNLYYDLYVAKYFADGSLSWVTHVGHKNYDDNYGNLVKDDNNNLIITGSTRNHAQFGEFTLDCDYSYPGFAVKIKDTPEENSYTSSGREHLYNLQRNYVTIYPNPFTTSTTIEYYLNSPQTVTITYYNSYGRIVDQIIQNQQQGLQKVVWTPEGLNEGIYYFRLRIGSKVASGKVILMR